MCVYIDMNVDLETLVLMGLIIVLTVAVLILTLMLNFGHRQSPYCPYRHSRR
jgi:hypothetical protein